MSTTDLLRVSCDASDATLRVRLSGEADFSVVGELAEALEMITPRRGQDVRLDVGGLRFVDIAAMRALVAFARRAAEAGARVTVVHARSSFTLLHRMLGVDELRVA